MIFINFSYFFLVEFFISFAEAKFPSCVPILVESNWIFARDFHAIYQTPLMSGENLPIETFSAYPNIYSSWRFCPISTKVSNKRNETNLSKAPEHYIKWEYLFVSENDIFPYDFQVKYPTLIVRREKGEIYLSYLNIFV